MLINRNSGNGYVRDYQTATNQAHENLLAAALEHPIDKSQMTIITNDSVFAVRAEMQGLSVHIPLATRKSQPDIAIMSTDMPIPFHTASPIESQGLQRSEVRLQDSDMTRLPPRSQRHRHNRKGLLASVKSYLTSILL